MTKPMDSIPLSEPLIPAEGETITPIANTNPEEECDISEIKMDDAKKKALFDTYQSIMEKEFSKNLSTFLLKIMQELRQAQCEDNIILSLTPLQQAAYKRLIDNKNIPYQECRELFTAITDQLEKKGKEPEQNKNYEILATAKRALDQYWLMTNIDIPQTVKDVRTVIVKREDFHITKRVKKSWWRVFLEKAGILAKTPNEQIVKRQNETISSIKKSATIFASEKLVRSYEAQGNKYLALLQAHVLVKNDPRRKKISPSSDQISQMRPSFPSEESPIFDAAVDIAEATTLGIAQTVLNLLPGEVTAPSKTDEKSLSTYIEETFELSAKKEAFLGLVQFASNIYSMQESLKRAQDNYSHFNIDIPTYEQIGFARIQHNILPQENGFNAFLTGLAKALGFEGTENLSAAIHDLFYGQVDEEKLQQAFSRFASGKTQHGVGLQASLQLFTEEYNNMLTNKKGEPKSPQSLVGSNHYLQLLDMNKQLLEDLQSKSRIKNAVTATLEISKIEETLYSPQAKGLTANITTHLRDKVIENIPSQVDKLLASAREQRMKTDALAHHYTENVLEHINEQLERITHDSTVTTSKREAPIISNRDAYLQAQKQADRKIFKTEADERDFVEKLKHTCMMEWKNFAIPILQNSIKVGGKNLLESIEMQIQQDIDTLKNNKAHPNLITELEKKLSLFRSVLSKDKTNINFSGITSNNIKDLIDVFYQGVTNISQNNPKLSFEQRNDLQMISMALAGAYGAYNFPNMTFSVYQDIMRTEYNELSADPSKASSLIAQKVFGKVQSMFNANNADSAKQLHYYVKTVAEKKVTHSQPYYQAKAPAKKQGWGEWASEYVTSAMNVAIPIATPVLEGIGRYAYGKITGRDNPATHVNTNQEVTQKCQILIREKTFESMFDMAVKMYQIHQNDKSFSEFGFYNKERFTKFLSNVAGALGFEDIKEIENILKIKQEIETLQLEVKRHPSSQELANKLEIKLTEKAMYDDAIQDLKMQFSDLPQTDKEKFNDPFVKLKSVIQDENQALIEKMESVSGLSSSASNYVVLVCSLNNIVSQVEVLQQQVIAAELFAPDFDKQFGIDVTAKDFWGQLKIALRNQAKDSTTAVLETRIISQLENAILGAQKFLESTPAIAQQKRQSLILSHGPTVSQSKITPDSSMTLTSNVTKKSRPGSGSTTLT